MLPTITGRAFCQHSYGFYGIIGRGHEASRLYVNRYKHPFQLTTIPASMTISNRLA